jgi:hypothetical protein
VEKHKNIDYDSDFETHRERIEKVEEEEEAFQKVHLFCPISLINGDAVEMIPSRCLSHSTRDHSMQASLSKFPQNLYLPTSLCKNDAGTRPLLPSNNSAS